MVCIVFQSSNNLQLQKWNDKFQTYEAITYDTSKVLEEENIEENIIFSRCQNFESYITVNPIAINNNKKEERTLDEGRIELGSKFYPILINNEEKEYE